MRCDPPRDPGAWRSVAQRRAARGGERVSAAGASLDGVRVPKSHTGQSGRSLVRSGEAGSNRLPQLLIITNTAQCKNNALQRLSGDQVGMWRLGDCVATLKKKRRNVLY